MKTNLWSEWRLEQSFPETTRLEYKLWTSPDMRRTMEKMSEELSFEPLFLLMSIANRAGIYNPKLGFAANAGSFRNNKYTQKI
jgi:hypothetical protein